MPDNSRPKIPRRQAITVDVGRYEHLLAGADVSEQERTEFLQAMWDIITAFVDLGFGVHPAQIVQDLCGKEPKNGSDCPSAEVDVICLEDILKDQFDSANKAQKGNDA